MCFQILVLARRSISNLVFRFACFLWVFINFEEYGRMCNCLSDTIKIPRESYSILGLFPGISFVQKIFRCLFLISRIDFSGFRVIYRFNSLVFNNKVYLCRFWVYWSYKF